MENENILVRKGKEAHDSYRNNKVKFLEDEDANALVCDLENFPHAFVLACFMDRQINAEKAWMIPFCVKNEIHSFKIEDLASIPEEKYKAIFKNHNLHRYNDVMSSVFYKAIQRIHSDYSDDASNIWKDCPGSAKVVYRFLEFDGVGIKIATMATNILASQFGVPFSDCYSIDISPDVHVKRVMGRMGLVDENASNEKIIYKARDLNPEYPGIIDSTIWQIGREWCKKDSPKCEKCIVSSECKYNLDRNH